MIDLGKIGEHHERTAAAIAPALLAHVRATQAQI